MPLLHSLLTVLGLTEFVQRRCWRLGRQVGADAVVLVRQQRALDGLCTQYESWVRTVERVWKYWPTVQTSGARTAVYECKCGESDHTSGSIQGTMWRSASAGAIPHILPRFFWGILGPIEVYLGVWTLWFSRIASVLCKSVFSAAGIAHNEAVPLIRGCMMMQTNN
jgi:hypothetical protein